MCSMSFQKEGSDDVDVGTASAVLYFHHSSTIVP